MAKFSIRRPDTQARVSVAISLASCVSLAALAALVFRHVDFAHFIITYGKQRALMVLGAGACTLLLAAIGFGMGLSSAGQRRNDQQKLSWIGFFLGAFVLCLALILLFLFKQRGELNI